MESLISSPYAFIFPISLFSTATLFLSPSLVVPSIGLRAPPLFSISRPLSHLDDNLFSVFKLNTDRLSRTTPRNVAGRTLSLDPLDSPFSHFSFFFLRSVHCRPLGLETYKYPAPGLVEGQATVAPFLSLSSSRLRCVLYDPLRLDPTRSETCVILIYFPPSSCFRFAFAP